MELLLERPVGKLFSRFVYLVDISHSNFHAMVVTIENRSVYLLEHFIFSWEKFDVCK